MLPLLQQNGVVDGNDTEILLPGTKLRSYLFEHLSLRQCGGSCAWSAQLVTESGSTFLGFVQAGFVAHDPGQSRRFLPTRGADVQIGGCILRSKQRIHSKKILLSRRPTKRYEDLSWGCSLVSTHLLYFFGAVLLIMQLTAFPQSYPPCYSAPQFLFIY
jgi:hypothetical protein